MDTMCASMKMPEVESLSVQVRHLQRVQVGSSGCGAIMG